MMPSNHDLITISAVLRAETDHAYLIYDGTRKAWVPISLTEKHEEADGSLTFEMPEWLAKEKGFI